MKILMEIWDIVNEEKGDKVFIGDINIDRHKPNDPTSRPDLKILNPLLEETMEEHSLFQMN